MGPAMVGTLFMTRLFVSKLSSGIMLISAIIESWKPDGGSGMVRIDQSVKVKLLLSEVGGSGTMILSKWEILETDTYSFTLHGHLHQVIYYFHSFAVN